MDKKIFEHIVNDSEKMAYYKESPLMEASFMALFTYVKKGHNIFDLPWFSLSRPLIKDLKKVA